MPRQPSAAELLELNKTKSVAEIAKLFNMTKGEVSGRIYRAKQKRTTQTQSSPTP